MVANHYYSTIDILLTHIVHIVHCMKQTGHDFEHGERPLPSYGAACEYNIRHTDVCNIISVTNDGL